MIGRILYKSMLYCTDKRFIKYLQILSFISLESYLLYSQFYNSELPRLLSNSRLDRTCEINEQAQ